MTISRKIADLVQATGDVKSEYLDNVPPGTDSEAVQNIALKTFTTLDSLPSTNLISGQQAWVESSGRLYISNGSGWYNIALINASPTLTLDQSGTIQLNADTLTVTVIASATDSDDNSDIITFSVESDGNMVGTGTSVSQDSSVFTITADSEGGNGVAGEFTLTFKATDGIAVDNEDLSFSLSFSNVVDSSAETVLLMKADGNNATNAAITYKNSSNVSTGFTEQGAPQAGTFSPYRSGGYSVYFDGDGDYLTIADDTSLDVGTGDFTLEAWFYLDADDGTYNICSQYSSGNSGGLWLGRYSAGFNFRRAGVGDVITADAVPSVGEWHHVAVSRASGSTKMFIDGTQTGSTVSSDTNNYSVSAPFYIGIDTPSDAGEMDGYIRDFRLIKGTGLYTTDFTPPTESLTAVSGTSLLACHLPYIRDGSTNDHTISQTGNPETRPFGPYDYEPWAAADHGGSVYFDGDGDYLQFSDVGLSGLAAAESFLIMCWVYPTVLNSNSNPLYSQGNDASLSNFFDFGYHSDGRVQCFLNSGSRTIGGTAGDIKLNQWNHVFISSVLSGSGLTKIYVNGIEKASGTLTGPLNTPTDGNGYIGSQTYDLGNSTRSIEGYIADFKIGLYNLTPLPSYRPPTSPSNTGSSTNPLVMSNQSDANIYDAAAANTFVLTNETKSSTTQRKFTTSSAVYLDGTNDQIIVYDKPLTGDLTIEGWFYQDIAQDTNYRWLFGSSTYAGSAPLAIYTRNAQVQGWANSSSANFVASSFTAQTWHHVAVVRNSGTWKIYLDGTGGGTTTTNGTYNFADTTDWWFGTHPNGSYDFKGYYQDWKISDRAVYTANFTPPTAEFEL